MVMARPFVGGLWSKVWFGRRRKLICMPSGVTSHDSKASPVMLVGDGIWPTPRPHFSGVLKMLNASANAAVEAWLCGSRLPEVEAPAVTKVPPVTPPPLSSTRLLNKPDLSAGPDSSLPPHAVNMAELRASAPDAAKARRRPTRLVMTVAQ